MSGQYLKPGDVRFCLAHVAEELGEAAAAAGKSLRWGLNSVNPEVPPDERETNWAWLQREMTDVKGAWERLQQAVEPVKECSPDIVESGVVVITVPRPLAETMLLHLQYAPENAGAREAALQEEAYQAVLAALTAPNRDQEVVARAKLADAYRAMADHMEAMPPSPRWRMIKPGQEGEP